MKITLTDLTCPFGQVYSDSERLFRIDFVFWAGSDVNKN